VPTNSWRVLIPYGANTSFFEVSKTGLTVVVYRALTDSPSTRGAAGDWPAMPLPGKCRLHDPGARAAECHLLPLRELADRGLCHLLRRRLYDNDGWHIRSRREMGASARRCTRKAALLVERSKGRRACLEARDRQALARLFTGAQPEIRSCCHGQFRPRRGMRNAGWALDRMSTPRLGPQTCRCLNRQHSSTGRYCLRLIR
jgi:hypothetical protein